MKKILTITAISLLAVSFQFCSSSKPKVKEEDVDKAVDVYEEYKDKKKPTKEDIYKVRERDFK